MSAYTEDEFPEHGMNVMGGHGEFFLQIWFEGDMLTYLDPSGPDESIDIWESDQGYAPSLRNCCKGDLALRMLEHFFKTGEPYPNATWE